MNAFGRVIYENEQQTLCLAVYTDRMLEKEIEWGEGGRERESQ